MKRLAAALVAFGAIAVGLFARKNNAVAAPSQDYGVQDLTTWAEQAWDTLTPPATPVPAPGRGARNLAAFLVMIRAAEGTSPVDGYGALFGWPAAGRWFDPYKATGHPKVYFNYTDRAGKTVKTSPAGAYQIVYTTWVTYYAQFLLWCSLQGISAQGFTPATQDAFATYLLDIDGALEHVKAGRLAQAMPIAARRWASLPGYSADNNPERTQQFVENSYKAAGGQIA